MRYRVLLAAAGLLAASTGVFGQAKLSGKWQTDNVPAALEAQKNPPPAPDPAAGGRGRGGGAQAIMLDLKIDNAGKISGTVIEIGNSPDLMIESGQVTGNMITWVTQPRGVTWNLEVTDDNTLTLTSRVFAARGGGGGAPGAGGPPGGGGGAPGGGARGGGAPGGGAPGGGGAGRGGGRGPAAPIVFHRTK